MVDHLGELAGAREQDAYAARDAVIEALEAIERHQPPAPPLSLILLDAHLPILEGEQILTYLQKRNLALPVVAISSDPDALETATALGVKATLEKPFSFDHMLNVVRQQVRLRAS